MKSKKNLKAEVEVEEVDDSNLFDFAEEIEE